MPPEAISNCPEHLKRGGANPMSVPKEPKECLVSAIIPVYNRMDFLPRALSSVLNQTYDNLQVIIVDDASEGDVGKVLDSFNDGRILYVRHEKNSGVAAAWNTGLRSSHGEYVAFLGDDDEWFKNKIERQLCDLGLRRVDHQVSYCRVDIFRDTDSKILRLPTFNKEGNILQYAIESCCVGLNAMVMKREDAIGIGGFDERFRKHEDWEFLIRLSKYHNFAYVDELLARVHVHRMGRLTDEYRNVPHYRKLLYECHKELYEANRKVHSRFLSELAYYLAISGRKREAQWFSLRSIALDPFRLDPYLRTAMMYANRFRTTDLLE
jgi:glycosyltransferase involved in cell wall biosynthesis